MRSDVLVQLAGPLILAQRVQIEGEVVGRAQGVGVILAEHPMADYRVAGKPVCDYEAPVARTALVDALARDGRALLGVLEGRELGSELAQAAALVATVIGQDLDEDTDGVFRIARRVAKDRVIPRGGPAGTARAQDRRARFRRLQGPRRHRPGLGDHHRYHGHPGNAGDASAATDLITDLAEDHITEARSKDTSGPEQPAPPGTEPPGTEPPGKVFGDCAYGSGEFQSRLEERGIDSGCKTQPPAPRPGGLSPRRTGSRPRRATG